MACALKSVALHDQYPKTVAHGDVHLKNWYVAGNGEMGLGDWQCAHHGHWARDVAYALSTALTIENRRDSEQDLLRYYLDRLHAAGGPKLDFNDAFTAYRQQLITALTWWTIVVHPAPGMPDMQPRDITFEFVRRMSTAMDDLDTLDSLRGV
ncbi:MAG: phosphotransferase [Steroidobacteraceae bacterium]